MITLGLQLQRNQVIHNKIPQFDGTAQLLHIIAKFLAITY